MTQEERVEKALARQGQLWHYNDIGFYSAPPCAYSLEETRPDGDRVFPQCPVCRRWWSLRQENLIERAGP